MSTLSRRARLARLEEARYEPVPLLIIFSDDDPGPEAVAAWEAEYGEAAREEVRAGRANFTGIDFRPPEL